MGKCGICCADRSTLLNNKLVCMRCDELLFDIEFECDEIEEQENRGKELVLGAASKSPTPSSTS